MMSKKFIITYMYCKNHWSNNYYTISALFINLYYIIRIFQLSKKNGITIHNKLGEINKYFTERIFKTRLNRNNS